MAVPIGYISDLLDLLRDEDTEVQKAIINYVQAAQDPTNIAQVVHAVLEKDIEKALDIIHERINFSQMTQVYRAAFERVGNATATELQGVFPEAGVSVGFDATSPRAAELITDGQLRFIRQLTDQQLTATRQAIQRGLSEGASTQALGRMIRNSIGLTPAQEGYVDSYRKQLENLSSRALDRALRDRRYDQTVEGAITRNRQLTPSQIDTMVGRYQANQVAMRAETIGRTEALTAFNQAREEALQQAMEQTRLNRDRVVRIWNATHDDRTREWHMSMDGQRQNPGEPFTDGLGNILRYPGDPLAPAESRINCRCTLTFDVERAD